MKILKNFLPQNIWELSVIIFPVIVDGADYFFFEHINSLLLTLLKKPSINSLSVMFSIYFMFIICIIAIELLVPDIRLKNVKLDYEIKDNSGNIKSHGKINTTWPELLFFYPSVGFGVIMILLIFNTLGMTSDTSPFTMDEQYMLIWPAIVLFFIQILAMVWKAKPRFRSTGPAYLAIYAPAVIICALVINLSVAAWQYLLGDPSLTPIAERGGKLLDWFLALPIFILFFSSPRFMFMSRHFNWLSMLSALALIAFFIWRSLDYIKIV
ncbi:MAG TPA: hypothetical protein PK358_10825 [Spirochaetota bacterium]|nr:hypothetical protein [Spirochaetota bacterium]HPJ35320.1 hypothetical protein [Spirochaetota bacterium]